MVGRQTDIISCANSKSTGRGDLVCNVEIEAEAREKDNYD